MNLRRLLRPNSIAVIGGLAAARVAEQCDRMAFSGELWPVHPQRKAVAGRPAFRTIEDLPHAPDAAFVGVNRHAAIEAVATLSKRGAGGAICYASGFQEASDGAALQQELLQAAGTMPLIGPNCYGLLNLADGVPLWPDQHGGQRLPADGRGVAIITQSSNIAISLTMQQRGLPIAYVATAGNQAQLGVSALATALLDDERVSALGLHVEGFDSIVGFEALSRLARERRVPVVVMKAGRSARGQAATLSHTASIAGSDAGANAFLKRLGFARATGIPEFLEALKVLHVHGPIDGPRIGVLCCSGGEASVVADAVDDSALALPELACAQAAAVRAQVHPLVDVANPLDYHTFSWGNEPALGAIFAAFADPATFDATLLVLDFPRSDRCDAADWQTTLDAFHKAMAETGSRGMIVATLGENMPEAKAAWLVERSVAPLCGISEALAAIECAATIGTAWRAP
ncbi:MAG: CoA-binding protein, partial [Gammaproteobacteria bacterium]|nr:CoA-binding protein [Gammaproteobacteria bacterium]